MEISWNFFKYKNFLFVFLTSALVLITALYLYQYLKVGSIYELGKFRSYDHKTLINIFSFFETERSNLWPKGLILDGYSKGNQQLYLGWGINILLIIFFLKRKILSQNVKFVRFFKLSIYPCILLFGVGSISFYFFLASFDTLSCFFSHIFSKL